MIDLTKAKAGDKIRFRGGSSAIVESIELTHIDLTHGGVFSLRFQDGTNARFTVGGKPHSKHSYWEDGDPYGRLDEGFEITSIRTPRRTDRPLSVSRAFNVASRRPGDHTSRHPALDFQTANLLRCIAGRYVIPSNYTAPEYEDLTSRKMHDAAAALAGGEAPRFKFWDIIEKAPPPEFLRKSWNKLVRLNPVLKGVRFDKANAEEMYNAHLGVTSGFNVDDINFFLEQKKVGDGLPAKQAREMPVHGERLQRIEAAALTPMFWVASPKTAEKVEERLLRHKAEAGRLQHQPARAFERAAGIKGIAAHYRYPHRMGAVEFDDYYTWTFTGFATIEPKVLAAKGITCPPVGADEGIDDYLHRTPPAFLAELQQAWTDMVRLNPVLKKVKFDRDNVNELYDAINGVASGFNTDDLNFFIARGRTPEAHVLYTNPAMEQVEAEAGANMEWIVSPKTFAKIEKKLHGKRGPKAA